MTWWQFRTQLQRLPPGPVCSEQCPVFMVKSPAVQVSIAGSQSMRDTESFWQHHLLPNSSGCSSWVQGLLSLSSSYLGNLGQTFLLSPVEAPFSCSLRMRQDLKEEADFRVICWACLVWEERNFAFILPVIASSLRGVSAPIVHPECHLDSYLWVRPGHWQHLSLSQS